MSKAQQQGLILVKCKLSFIKAHHLWAWYHFFLAGMKELLSQFIL